MISKYYLFKINLNFNFLIRVITTLTDNNLRFEQINGYIKEINNPILILIEKIDELANEKK